MEYIQNPILKGFNPDPSICRVGDDYYIATSTFEWFPGVQIHHSKDLKHWQVIARPLNRLDQLDLKGVPDSCGVWAPCLSYDNGTFYLVYSNVKSFDGGWMDTPNYVITTEDIKGEWSKPVYLNSNGFDGSFFHEKGRTYYLSMRADYRKTPPFNGILLQEYDKINKRLVDNEVLLTKGTYLGSTEGPHIYKHKEYYYLVVAEGGTEYNHAVSVFRAKTVNGPYKEHPDNPVLTSKDYPENNLQKAGHASFVKTQNEDWYMVFLVGRPLSKRGRCTLGRETAIEELVWKDGWPYLKNGGKQPRTNIPMSRLPEYKFEYLLEKDDFDSQVLNPCFQSLRIPVDQNWLSLTERPGYLRLKGKESLASTHSQSLIARRIQHFKAEVTTCVEFEPKVFKQLAGLVFYYNTGHFHYLAITRNDTDKTLSVISSDNFKVSVQEEEVVISGKERIFLKGIISSEDLQFYYSIDEVAFHPIGDTLDMSILSDDYIQNGNDKYRPAFTGAFVGLCCQDLKGNSLHADFDWFEYKEIKK
ncbi:glycoside hydrolase family 43 protein [Seonamhaeicola sp.]|uniref:glycoside hydrolase family 43 protein n=1 Tax=Seonamhaeicola sp. TaxID=1912245 RepID=UPI00260B4050|nr:glycoside hydrolase family 43 protein [Seonamhaeicola sp.]